MATYSYSGDPSSSPRDEVRFLLSDTASTWMFSDKEIDYMLSRDNDEAWRAASNLAMAKASYYLRRGSISIDGITLDYGSRGRALLDLAKALETASNKNTVGPPVTAGGIDKQFDVGLVQPLNDYPSVFAELDYPK